MSVTVTPMISPDGTEAILVGGEVITNIHRPSRCAGSSCCVHNPSDHTMVSWPQHYRQDRGVMERVCAHGVGHPDPDDVTCPSDQVHGCDGCCDPLNPVTHGDV